MSVPAENPKQKSTILIVAADESEQQRLQSILQEGGYFSFVASDPSTALQALRKQNCEVIVLDLEIPGVDTLAFCQLLLPHLADRPLSLLRCPDGLATGK